MKADSPIRFVAAGISVAPASARPGQGPTGTELILTSALTMSVAWGLRGFIGGGSLGAMIPGALMALVLCYGIRLPEAICGRVAAFGAIGIGFGGQETYGQTVRFVTDGGEMFWQGVAGLGVKGAVWGWVGGMLIAFACMVGRAARRDLFIALALLVAGTWVGWRVIDRPKLIYFSNLLNQPRAEIWAGLLIGGAAFLGWIAFAQRSTARTAITFALLGAVGGGLGFAVGGVAYAGGMALGWPARWYPGWKQMEFTFGFVLGAALGWAAWRQREIIAKAVADIPPRSRAEGTIWWPMASAVVAGALLWACSALPVRFSYTIGGAMLLALAFVSERAAWQIAITVTAGAFFLDVGRYFSESHPTWHPLIATTGALLLAGVLSWRVAARHASGRDMATWALLVLLWTAIAAATGRTALYSAITPAAMLVMSAFVAGAVLITQRVSSGK